MLDNNIIMIILIKRIFKLPKPINTNSTVIKEVL